MTKTIQAVFEHGILRPLEPIEGIRENTEVEITIIFKQKEVSPVLRFAGILSKEEANRMLKVVEEEFERVNPDEWKD
ncbi:MAG: antitoxin family protein [Candidatus Brocadia sinica]|nr:antitoxin family protein [Candidatus Brocadia sinica]NUO06678.1 antitoxin family protein [Candidatus Brocadia sinica]